MSIRKVTLSLILFITVFLNSLPTFAVNNVDNQNNEYLQNSDSKAIVKILSEDSKSLSSSDIIKDFKESLNSNTSKNSLVGKVEFEEGTSNKSDNDYIKDSGNIKDSGVARKKSGLAKVNVVGPDLAIGNLAVNTTQPFSYTDYTNFDMLIANIGGQSISNVTLEVFVENTKNIYRHLWYICSWLRRNRNGSA